MSNPSLCAEISYSDKTSTMLKALGHSSRVDIIRQLASRDRCCAGDFCNCMALAQSTISQHLEMLCEAGLVEKEAIGTKSMFTLNRKAFDELIETLGNFSSSNSLQKVDTNKSTTSKVTIK